MIGDVECLVETVHDESNTQSVSAQVMDIAFLLNLTNKVPSHIHAENEASDLS